MKSNILSTTALTALVAGSLLLDARADITTGLMGYWKFDDGSGSSTAADSSPSAANGALTGFSDATFTSMWSTNARFGDALLFNANGETTDFVSVPDATNFDYNGNTKAVTLAAWVYCSVPGGAQSNGAPIISKGAVGLEQYSLDVAGGVFRCTTRNSSGKSQQVVNSTVSPVSNTWYHVVAIWSAAPQQHWIYINGSFNNTYSGSGFLTTEYTTNAPLTIGGKASAVTAGAPNLPFQGIIDDVHIYNRVLTASDIYQLYTNGATHANSPGILIQPRGVSGYLGDSPAFNVTVNSSTTLLPVTYQWQLNGSNISGATTSALVVSNAQATNAGTYTVQLGNFEGTNSSSNAVLTLQSLPVADTNSGLAGWWKFDDASGSSTAADSSANADAGALSGFVDTTYTSMWTAGVFGGALAFNGDGTGSNVVAVPGVGAPAPAVLDFSARPVFTLSAWVMGGATQTNGGGVIAKGTGGGGEEYVVDIFGGFYRFFVRDTNQTVYTAQTAVAPNGFWQHMAAVLDASNGIMNCYVSGKLAAEAVAPFSLQTNSHELSIGNRQPGAGNYGDAFTGSLDDVRVYNRALTSADVTALYNAAPAPLVVTWATSNFDVVTRANAQLAPALFGGVPPYSYQWQQNGSNITGATNYPLLLNNAGAAAAGAYDLILSNSTIVAPVTSSVVNVSIVPSLTFNTNGVTWTAEGSTTNSTWPGTNVLVLSTGVLNQSNSAFYNFPLQVGAFQASFTYRLPSGTQSGVTFCIQDDPRGSAAIGADSGELGVGNVGGGPGGVSITPSVEFEINLFPTIGVSFDTNGVIGPVDSSAPLAINTAAVINATLTYQSNVLTVTLADTNAGTQFSASTNVNITNVLGSPLGYVGFTGATGAAVSAQQISNFEFDSLVAAPPTIVAPPQSLTNLPAGQNAVFSVGAFGSIPFGFQWALNGTNLNNGPSFTGSGAVISGATTSNLTVAGAQVADNGTYSVLITNGFLPNASTNAVLTVKNAPQIISQSSTNLEVFAGAGPVLVMNAAGLAPLSYQWTSNGVVIAGATLSSYTVNAQASATYVGTASNSFGTNATSPVILTVLPDPTAPYPLAVLASHPMDYWRLDEVSGSTVSYDYAGGNNGIYSNVYLGYQGYTVGFNPQSDPNETSAYFGNYGSNNNYMGSVPANVNFAAPTNASAEFSVETWVNPTASPAGAGLVSLGYGNGGEQFCLDMATSSNVLRFFVRNAGGALFTAQSTFVATGGSWHHVVGVCDQANSSLYLYADGQLVASNAVPAGGGLLASAQSLTIGARQSALGSPYNDQVTGAMDDVALYNYALSPGAVLAHYYAAGIAPTVQAQPSSQDADAGATVTITAAATGTAPLFYFWTDQNSVLVSTNSVLVLNNVPAGSSNFTLLVTNLYGQQSTSASLNVYGGPVALYSDLSPLLLQVPPGYPITYTVGMYGSPPIRYQWFINTNTPIPGATNSSYSFLASVGTNTYTLWATNQSGASTAVSSTATLMVSATPPVIGFGDGTAWGINGGASFINSPLVLELTDGNVNEARSAFFNSPQYINGFLASFTYTPSGGSATRADGVTFTLQNSPSGVAALGIDGGGLGYDGIAPSVAFEMDLYTGSPGGTGINWETNGLAAEESGLANGGTGSVNINSLDPINVSLFYNASAGQLHVKLVDAATSAAYITNYNVGSLPALLGTNFAYVGFTGGTGGSDAIQEISNFAYSYSADPSLTSGHGAGGNLVINWPAAVATNFVLQQSGAVSGPWSNVTTATNLPTVGNAQYQVTVPPAGSAQFYRLSLP